MPRLGAFFAENFRHYSTAFLNKNARPVPDNGLQKPPALAYTGFNPDTVPQQCVALSVSGMAVNGGDLYWGVSLHRLPPALSKGSAK
jgi:hypothetical protein